MSKFQEVYERVVVRPDVVSEEKIAHVEWLPFMKSLLEATGYTIENFDNGDFIASRGPREVTKFKANGICSKELFEHVITQAVKGFSTVSEQTVKQTEQVLEAFRKEWESK